MTKRKPSRDEEIDVRYGRKLARTLASADIGQSVAISEKACVAAEAMEGTDAMLRRAATLNAGRPLRLVKASNGRAHLYSMYQSWACKPSILWWKLVRPLLR